MTDWNEALYYGSFVKLAGDVKPSGSQLEIEQALEAEGYELQQTVYGDDLATDVDPHLGDPVSFGYIALSYRGELLIALRGTDTILEWLHDVDFLMVPSPVSEGFTDDGFTSIYKSLRIGKLTPDAPRISVKDYIKSQIDVGIVRSVTICGHSMGGALGTLLALDLARHTACKELLVYTYASPRVGDHLFVDEYKKYVTSSFRVANRLDLVTMMPTVFPLPYEHVQEHCELKPDLGEIRFTIPCMHYMATYLYLVGKAAGNKQFALEADCMKRP